ncbi:hypothetical protein [Pseudogemmobacter humi]|nr:hypothetical protein [Pseudogemmobacter humi]
MDAPVFRAHRLEGTMQRLSLELLIYTGLRRSDVVWLGGSTFRAISS